MRVEVSNLGFSYVDKEYVPKPALANLDLVVPSGTITAVVGVNGSGKSTLLRVIARLEKPSAGTIRFVGEQRYEHLTALVFQDPTLIPWWNVGRNVAISAEFSDKPQELYERIEDFHSKQVGLGDLLKRFPQFLSRGQQTRAAIGRAFAHDSDVVLLDEPFVHLDAVSRRRLQHELETHWQLDPRTTILVSHDVEEAVMLADRVAVMRAGPGPLVETVEVDVARPRTTSELSEPGLRSATVRVWDALERSQEPS